MRDILAHERMGISSTQVILLVKDHIQNRQKSCFTYLHDLLIIPPQTFINEIFSELREKALNVT